MHLLMMRAARGMAFLGGLMLVALILMTCVSILGRGLNDALHSDGVQAAVPTLADWLLDAGVGAINGDFELIEAGIVFSIFAFLPYCHLTGGHARVDVFTTRMSARANRVLTAVSAIVFAAVLILIAVQLHAGLQSKLRTGQTTFLLEFPIWWAYALSLSGAALAAITGVYLSVIRVAELFKGADLIPQEDGAEH